MRARDWCWKPISLPPWDELRGELTTPKFKEAQGGKIQLESKDDIRKRLGRSPDVADAVAYAYWVDCINRGPIIVVPMSVGKANYWRECG